MVPGALIRGIGGEVAAADPDPLDGLAGAFTDTLERPNRTSTAASRWRMELAAKIGTGTLARAVVAAGTLGATNSSGAESAGF